jgi:hypothetical protein
MAQAGACILRTRGGQYAGVFKEKSTVLHFHSFAALFIMRPHPDHLNGFNIVKNLINETMLYVDSSGICAGEVTDELFERGWILVRVLSKDVQ